MIEITESHISPKDKGLSLTPKYIAKSNTMDKVCNIISPYNDTDLIEKNNLGFRQTNGINKRRKQISSHAVKNRGNKSISSTDDNRLYGTQFHAIDNGTFYYNSKRSQEFILSSSGSHENPKVANKAMNKYLRPIKTTSEANRSSDILNQFEAMKAVGKSYNIAESRKNVNSSKKIIKGDEGGQYHEYACKRFSEKWQRMTENILENNRAMKVQNRIDPSPVVEEAVESRTVYSPVANTQYKSYLKDQYRFRLNKTYVKSEYAVNTEEEDFIDLDENLDAEGFVSKAWETHNKKYDITSIKDELGFKTSGEILEMLTEEQQNIINNEKLKRIKDNINASNAVIKNLEMKYDFLYDQIGMIKGNPKIGRAHV